MNYGVNRYQRPQPITPDEEKARQAEREEYVQRHINQLWNTIPKKTKKKLLKRFASPATLKKTYFTLLKKCTIT